MGRIVLKRIFLNQVSGQILARVKPKINGYFFYPSQLNHQSLM